VSLSSRLTEASDAAPKQSGTVRMVHEIFEGDTPYPVVTHVFTGKTREEAKGYFKAHMKTDRFMREMETSGKFGEIKGRTKVTWK
jgi:hypothetical protein